jgi:hypothetical protein
MKNNTPNLPNSLVEAIRHLADADRCFEFVKGLSLFPWALGLTFRNASP